MSRGRLEFQRVVISHHRASSEVSQNRLDSLDRTMKRRIFGLDRRQGRKPFLRRVASTYKSATPGPALVSNTSRENELRGADSLGIKGLRPCS